ncbi:hypothetical protein PUR59_01300, partial [Streptomyces sp. SP18ES09]|uniref:hypothetical protein n=1 Tax=Streptomyces sp. SP18ES09 TaxID=3002532 RepID=UPI002E78522B
MTQPVDPTLAVRQDNEVLMQRGPIVGAEVGRLLAAYRAAILREAIDAVLGRITAYEGMGQE